MRSNVIIENKKPGGRKSKLTATTAAVILEALQKHNYVNTACQLAGISEATFYNWLDKAEAYKNKLISGSSIDREGERYIKFFDSVKQAQAGSEVELLGRINTAGSVPTLIEQRTITHTLKDGTTKTEVLERWKPAEWQANSWILERTKWEKYGQHSSLDIQQAGVVFIERLQRARAEKVVEGQFHALEDITNEPVPIEVSGTGQTTEYNKDSTLSRSSNRPILKLIQSSRVVQVQMDEPNGNQEDQRGNEAQPDTLATAKSEGGDSDG